jgi:D-lactate dehydrogenase
MVQISKLLEAEGLASKQDTESLTRRLVWSRDASHFRIMPGATHKATDLESVARLLGLANQHGYPVTFRSGGSSLSGQTVGHGVVVDTRSGFQSLVSIGEDSITAQPGVTLARLNGHLSRRGRKVGPDPASMVASTLGGAVSNNSSGMTCGTELNSYRTIRSAKIAFADGQILDTSAADSDSQLRALRPDIYKLLENKRDQIRSNRAHQQKIRHLFRLKNTMGYSLNAFLDFDSPVEILLRLLVGAEGTLAFLGEVELATVETLPIAQPTCFYLMTLSLPMPRYRDSLNRVRQRLS